MTLSVRTRYFACGFAALACVATFGFGCAKQPTATVPASQAVAGLKTASFEGVSPAEATKKLILTPSSVIVLRQNFSDAGEALAASMGLGKSVERSLVIRRFAPGNMADIEWKAQTTVQKGDKTESRQLVGSIAGIGLKDGRELLLPALWNEGIKNAGGLSAIWLSADVFENINKAQASTLIAGIANAQTIDLMGLPKVVVEALKTVRTTLKTETAKKDIEYATSSSELGRMDVNANGSRITVEVMNINTWYGKFAVLHNEQNPIILKFTPSKELESKGIAGFYGFEVTDFKDIQE